MTELTCHVCGKKYTVEHLDPESPAAYECIDCYKVELESTEIVAESETVAESKVVGPTMEASE